jgi:hypothetical protein
MASKGNGAQIVRSKHNVVFEQLVSNAAQFGGIDIPARYHLHTIGR